MPYSSHHRLEKQREAMARYRASHPENVRQMSKEREDERCVITGLSRSFRRKLGPRYGTTPEAWVHLLVSQCGRCAICAEELRDPVVDHDHVTGTIRALLCRRCNSGLGLFKDDPNTLLSAAHYLKGHHENR